VITDAAIGAISIAAVVAVIVAIDDRVPREMWRLAHGGPSAGSASLPEHTAMLVRSGWDLTRMHAPMAGFAAIAVVLVLCMVRMK